MDQSGDSKIIILYIIVLLFFFSAFAIPWLIAFFFEFKVSYNGQTVLFQLYIIIFKCLLWLSVYYYCVHHISLVSSNRAFQDHCDVMVRL